MKLARRYILICLAAHISEHKCARPKAPRIICTCLFFSLKLAYACLCEEPPESCCINRTSSRSSSKVHHFNYCCRKRPSTRNTSRVAAARSNKEQPPTSLLADRRAAATSGSLHRYRGLMTSLLEESYNGTRLFFWENSQK